MGGHICLGCSPITKAKLAALRTGVCLCGIPIVTVVLATASVPVVVFAPLATIYEPVCRLRKSKSNPFKEAMVQGSLMVIIGAANACEKIGILASEDVTQHDNRGDGLIDDIDDGYTPRCPSCGDEGCGYCYLYYPPLNMLGHFHSDKNACQADAS